MHELLDIAIMAYRTGRYGESIGLLRHVANAMRDTDLPLFYLALAYEKSGCKAEAQRVLEELAAYSADSMIRRRADIALTNLKVRCNGGQLRHWISRQGVS